MNMTHQAPDTVLVVLNITEINDIRKSRFHIQVTAAHSLNDSIILSICRLSGRAFEPASGVFQPRIHVPLTVKPYRAELWPKISFTYYS